MKTYLLTALITIGGATAATAQDFHFSDPTRTLTLFNPAYTGLIPEGGKYRVQTVMRSQWASVLENDHYRTFAATADVKICGNGADNYFAFGASGAVDVQGDPALRRTDAYLTGSLVLRVGGKRTNPNSIGGGVELGRIQYSSVGLLNRTFDEQFDNPTLPGEFSGQAAISTMDVGFGAFYSATGNTSGVHDLGIAGSVKHLTRPALGYFGNTGSGAISSDSTARLNRRLNVNGNISVSTGDFTSLSLFAAYSNQQPHNMLLTRLMFNWLGKRKPLNSNSEVTSKLLSAGVAVRLNDGAGGAGGDALIAIGQLHQRQYTLYLAYDYNISGLSRSTGGNGAVELGASIYFGKSTCVNCPTF